MLLASKKVLTRVGKITASSGNNYRYLISLHLNILMTFKAESVCCWVFFFFFPEHLKLEKVFSPSLLFSQKKNLENTN